MKIYEGRKRDTGGKLLVRIRVCYPLLKKEIIEEPEDIIVIQKHYPLGDYSNILPDLIKLPAKQPKEQNQTKQPNSTITTIPVAKMDTTTPSSVIPTVQTTPVRDTVSTPQIKQEPLVKVTPESREPTSTPQVASTNIVAPQSTDGNEIDYNPIDNMISNDVLEWALDETVKEIQTYKNQNKPVPEELLTKQQQLDVKMQLLILQIQTGKLSEEQYVELVTQKIAEEKELAKQYMKQNDRKGATYALKRAKLMTTELEGE